MKTIVRFWVVAGVLVVGACEQQERATDVDVQPVLDRVRTKAEKLQAISEVVKFETWDQGEEIITTLSSLTGPESHIVSAFYVQHADACAHHSDWSCVFDNLDRAEGYTADSAGALTAVKAKRSEYASATLLDAKARTKHALSRTARTTRSDISNTIVLWTLYEDRTGHKADARDVKKLNKRLKVVLREEEALAKKKERIGERLAKKKERAAVKSAAAERRNRQRLERPNVQRSYEPVRTCCKVCRKGKPCGDSCIRASSTCHKGRGCAC